MTGAAEHAQQGPAGPSAKGTDNAPVRLPPFKVRIESADVAEFLRATTGHPKHHGVPLTFPVRWLALPEVRGLILRSIGNGFIPVHEGQNFAYERALQIGADYTVDIEAFRTPAPPHLTLRMSVVTEEGEICARLETVMRIVPALKPA